MRFFTMIVSIWLLLVSTEAGYSSWTTDCMSAGVSNAGCNSLCQSSSNDERDCWSTFEYSCSCNRVCPSVSCSCQCINDCSWEEAIAWEDQCEISQLDSVNENLMLDLTNEFVAIGSGNIPVPLVGDVLGSLWNLWGPQGDSLYDHISEYLKETVVQLQNCMDQKINVVILNEMLDDVDINLRELHNNYDGARTATGELQKDRLQIHVFPEINAKIDSIFGQTYNWDEYEGLLPLYQSISSLYTVVSAAELVSLLDDTNNFGNDRTLIIKHFDILDEWSLAAKESIISNFQSRIGINACRNNDALQSKIAAFSSAFDDKYIEPVQEQREIVLDISGADNPDLPESAQTFPHDIGDRNYDQCSQICNTYGQLATKQEILDYLGPQGAVGGDVWTPVRDSHNDWLQIGGAGWPYGYLHTEIAGGIYGKPAWGSVVEPINFKETFYCTITTVTQLRQSDIGTKNYDQCIQSCATVPGSRLATKVEVLDYLGSQGAVGGDVWTPVSDSHNDWLQIGGAGWPYGYLHTEIADGVHGKPAWGSVVGTIYFKQTFYCT